MSAHSNLMRYTPSSRQCCSGLHALIKKNRDHFSYEQAQVSFDLRVSTPVPRASLQLLTQRLENACKECSPRTPFRRAARGLLARPRPCPQRAVHLHPSYPSAQARTATRALPLKCPPALQMPIRYVYLNLLFPVSNSPPLR